jgi:hypothetical protein
VLQSSPPIIVPSGPRLEPRNFSATLFPAIRRTRGTKGHGIQGSFADGPLIVPIDNLWWLVSIAV